MGGLLSSLAGKPAVVLAAGAGSLAVGLGALGVFSTKPDPAPSQIAPASIAALPETTPEPALAAPEIATAEPETVRAPEPAATPQIAESESGPEPGPEPEAESAPPKVETAEKPGVPPKFDVVRIETDGTALIAGTVAPGATAVLSLDGKELERVTGDSGGKFAAFLTLDPSNNARVLTLDALVDGEMVPSQEQVIVAATPQTVAPEPEVDVAVADTPAADPEPTPQTLKEPVAEAEGAQTPEPQPREETETAAVAPSVTAEPTALEEPVVSKVVETPEVAPEPASEIAAVVAPETTTPETVAPEIKAPDASSDTTTPETTTPEVTQPNAPTPSVIADNPAQPGAPDQPASTADTPSAPTVFLATRDGVRVLQAPRTPERGPAVPTALAIDAISYSDAGDVALAGRGLTGGFVRIYLDNAPVTTSRIEGDGNWAVDLPDIDTGVYTLRIDAVSEAGNVTSRVETPFKRESEDVLARAAELAADAETSITAVTVQPGSTLWAIAQTRYGTGVDYVRVFDANRDLIRDPDLIYPGQVFAIPD